MNNKKNANSMLLVEILVGTVWLIAMLLFVDFENADVLFLYSTMVLNNSETLK